MTTTIHSCNGMEKQNHLRRVLISLGGFDVSESSASNPSSSSTGPASLLLHSSSFCRNCEKLPLPLQRNRTLNSTAANGTPLSLGDFQAFIRQRFEDAGADLEISQPPEFVPDPDGFLPEVRAWTLDVHSLWKNLSRKVSASVKNQPQRHTLLPLPDNVVVPGSGFERLITGIHSGLSGPYWQAECMTRRKPLSATWFFLSKNMASSQIA